MKSSHVVFPRDSATFNVKVFLEDASPFGTGDVLINQTQSLRTVDLIKLHLSGKIHVRSELLPSLVVKVVNRPTLVLNYASKSFEISGSSGCGNLRSETVTSDSGHSNLLLIHPTDNVSTHFLNLNYLLEIKPSTYLHVIGCVVIGRTLVSVIKQHHVSHIKHFVSLVGKKFFKVLSRFRNLRKPYHSW